MRLLTVDARETRRDRAALARSITDVDLAVVRHAPHLLRWRSLCAAIGRRSGLVVVCGGRTGGANLLLSTLSIDVLGTRELSFGTRPVVHPVGAAVALMRHGGRRFVVAAATLSGDPGRRLAQATQLSAAIEDLGGGAPAVLSVLGAGTAMGADAEEGAIRQLLLRGRIAADAVTFVDERMAVEQASADEQAPSAHPVLLQP